MKNIPILIVATFICMAWSLNAQINTYDLNKYMRPDLHRRVVNVKGGLYGDSYGNYQRGLDRRKDQFRIQGNVSYREFWNNKKYQRALDGNLFMNLGSQNNALDYALSGRAQFSSRTYLGDNHKGLYWLGGAGFNGNYLANRRTTNQLTLLSGEAGIGYGRIEPINDAWHAGRMLQMLQKDGMLGAVTHDQLDALAIKVAQIKNMRVYDFRLNYIAELDALAEALKEIGLVEEVGYAMANRINDAYRYESFVPRSTGWRMEGKLKNQISLGGLYYINQTSIHARYEKAKALSFTQQLEYGVGVSTGMFTADFPVQLDRFRHTIDAKVSYGWYPSYRSYYDITVRPYVDIYGDRIRPNIEVSAEARYYLSPRLQLVGWLRYNSSPRVVSPVNFSFQQSGLGLEFRYSIF